MPLRYVSGIQVWYNSKNCNYIDITVLHDRDSPNKYEGGETYVRIQIFEHARRIDVH